MTDTPDALRIATDLRTHAYDDCGWKEVPTHIANIAADIITTQAARLAALEAEVARLRVKATPNCWWHPDSSETQMISPTENAIENGDYGCVQEIWKGRNMGSCFVAVLPPADDVDSGDEWEIVADSQEEAQAALDAEVARRAALTDPAP